MGLLYLIGYLAQLTPLILYFAFFTRIGRIAGIRVVFFYVFASCVSLFLMGALKKYDIIIISVFEIIEFVFFSIFFFLFLDNIKFKRFIVVVSSLNLFLGIFLFLSHKESFDFWAPLTTAILIVIYSILFFYEQVNSSSTLIVYQSYKFWVVVGCIIYISGTLFLFLYTSDLKDKQNSALWIINIAFEIIKNVCFSVAFIVARNNQRNLATQGFDDTNIFEKPF